MANVRCFRVLEASQLKRDAYMKKGNINIKAMSPELNLESI